MENDNKFSLLGFLDLLSSIVFLNLLFLVCSLPIITMGASLTALYGGLRAHIKKEPCYKAFFRTFRKSFLRSTLAWIILLPINVLFIYRALADLVYLSDGGSIPSLVISILFVVVCLSFTSLVFLFYSRFEATTLQLFQYSAQILFASPIRSIIVGVLSWFPFILPLFAVGFQIFLLLGLVWLFYFSTIGIMSIWLMNQPFALFAINILEMEDHRKDESNT